MDREAKQEALALADAGGGPHVKVFEGETGAVVLHELQLGFEIAPPALRVEDGRMKDEILCLGKAGEQPVKALGTVAVKVSDAEGRPVESLVEAAAHRLDPFGIGGALDGYHVI